MEPLTTANFSAMQAFFATGATRSYEFRKKQLQVLKKAIQQFESQIMDALFKDLHKSKEEALTTEIGFLYAEISHSVRYLKSWMKKAKVKTPLVLLPSTSFIIREPLGICLIIAPWNYPFQLLFAPLIGAIAGGNCAVLKPYELTPHTSAVVVKMVTTFFDKIFVTVVEGDGAVVVPKLMNEYRFDHIFFTGSIPVGKEIAKMAAEKLVPVTLELGGKSPCIVDEDADIEVAAKRIVWGKFTNAGQTCVAPDYVLVHESVNANLLQHMQKAIRGFYGENPQMSEDYGRIVNIKRLQKLQGYLNQGTVILGGTVDNADLYFAPTIMVKLDAEASIMKEEIFGPLLPILSFKNPEEVVSIIEKSPNPLSLYYFGNNRKNEKTFTENIQFGGGCINNTLVHLANADLPFGGVGNSGVGSYHGKFSFDTFTRQKAILKTATWVDPQIKYPPYTGKLKLLKWFFK